MKKYLQADNIREVLYAIMRQADCKGLLEYSILGERDSKESVGLYDIDSKYMEVFLMKIATRIRKAVTSGKKVVVSIGESSMTIEPYNDDVFYFFIDNYKEVLSYIIMDMATEGYLHNVKVDFFDQDGKMLLQKELQLDDKKYSFNLLYDTTEEENEKFEEFCDSIMDQYSKGKTFFVIIENGSVQLPLAVVER